MCNCKEYLGFEPKKIILLGDSAGGNLMLAITNMCINRGFKIPDGIFGNYPAVNCCQSEFWPSLLLGLDDLLLPL